MNKQKKWIAAALALAACLMVAGCGRAKSDEKLMEFPMDGESMENTILSGETVVFDRNAYKENAPERYDIILFKYPDDTSEKFVGRIIGLPGETVSIESGKVYVDGESDPLDDSFCPEEPLGDFGSYEVPEDSFFILGDNRNYSKDSRFWENKYVAAKDILGKAELE